MKQHMTSALSTTASNILNWCVLLMLFSLCCLPALGDDTTTFTFAPPDGMTYTTTKRTNTTTKSVEGGHSEKEMTEQTVKTKTEIHKTAEGYTITITELSVDETNNGNATDPDPLAQASVGIPLIFHLDKDGKLLFVEGIDKIIESCKRDCSSAL